MDTPQTAFGADFHIATLVGHRIAVDTLLKHVIVDLYSRIDGGAEAFETQATQALTDMHGVSPKGIGRADAEYVKQHALHSLEGLAERLANDIRKLRGEPPQRPS